MLDSKILPLATLLLALGACSKPESKPTPEPLPSAPAGATTTAAAKPATVGTPTAATSAIAAKPLPAGRSAIPTLAEWNSQQKEVTVKGSSALSCETKIVREYLRVSCRGKNDSGGTPTNVVVQKGGHGEALTFVSAGVTSLIVPFIEGIDFAADFSWTDNSHRLTVQWPRGSARPVVVGVFEGAKSPLDAAFDKALADKACQCHKQITGLSTCDELWGVNADCARTYPNDCARLLECSRGEPGVWPSCLPGFANGPFGFCYKKCGPGKTCGPDETCQGDDGSYICL